MIFNKDQFNTFEQLVRSVHTIPRQQLTLIIGIDGCGGAGKSTFANQFKEDCTDVTVVHMDDFYLPSSQIINIHPQKKPVGADVDWQRVFSQVLEPLSQNMEGKYQRYDWGTDDLAEWHTVPVGGIVIIEGVYSTRKELEDKYDYKIWVDCPRETRLARGLERDGEEARSTWEDQWMISEDMYVDQHQPAERADLIVNGTT